MTPPLRTLILVIALAFPGMATAASRYASPTPTGAQDCSSPANACDVKTAVESAGTNDDVFIPGNLGDYAATSIQPAAAPIHVHGTDGRPRIILSSAGFRLKGPSTAENLYVEGPGTTFALDLPTGASANDVIAKVTNTSHACYLGGGQTLTNSVCWAGIEGDLAIETDGSNTLRNDTLFGGAEAALKSFGRSSECGCSAVTTTLVNVIARSKKRDLAAESDGTADMTISATSSSYKTTILRGDGAPAQTHIVGDATNQIDAPLFVNAAQGDFHQAPGSPTIDAGVDDAANGTNDFDGDPRTAGMQTDIGADESVGSGGGPTPTPRPSPEALDHFSGYGVKPSKGHPAFVPIGPVTLADRFTTRNYDVLKTTTLLLPADKNGGGLQDAATHLLAYSVKASKGQAKFEVPPDVHVLNQCSDVALVAKKAVTLLVPTAKDLASAPTPPVEANHELDHFLCYAAKARTKLAKGTQVQVGDQFQTRRYDLKKIDKLCVPVAKSGAPLFLKGENKGTPATITPAAVRHVDGLLVCYQAKLATKEIPQLGCGPVDPKSKGAKLPKQPKHAPHLGVFVANQLGTVQVDSRKELALCVPSVVQ